MSYCTIDDLKKIETETSIIQLTDDRPPDDSEAGTVDAANLAEQIKLADGYIDSKLRGHVTLPLATPAPDIITQLSAELSIVNLYKRRFGAAMPEAITKRQVWVEKVLSEIVDGMIIISQDQQDKQPGVLMKTKTREKVYTEDYLKQF